MNCHAKSDTEVKLDVFLVLKASLECFQKMVEGATRCSDQQVLKAMKDREVAAETLRKRSAGLANASEDAFLEGATTSTLVYSTLSQ